MDYFMFIISIKSIHNYISEYINTNNNGNSQAEKHLHINTNKCLCYHQSCQIITNDNLDENGLNKKANTTLVVTSI